MDSDIKQENHLDGVKVEDDVDPSSYLEENESLDMNLAHGSQKIWLVKLPRYLAEKWTRPGYLNGQDLGQVKIRKNAPKVNGKRKLEVKLVLRDAAEMPQEYDLLILNTQVRNLYVFSEENLKRFRPDAPVGDEAPNRGLPFYRVKKKIDPNSEEKPLLYVKTIPKKTSLVGRIVHECQVTPLKGDVRYKEMTAMRQNIPQAKERPKVTLLDEIPGVVQLQTGPSLSGRSTSMFLKQQPARNKADGRAIRMPKNDLLDLLFRLFEEYEYWLMKGLKERTRQPETYLKELLEEIANLIKKGPYTSKYNLKPEYKRLRDAERAARAEPERDDDDDVEMEDII